MLILLRCLACLLAMAGFGAAADLTSTGDWLFAVNGSHLQSGAGSDLPAQFQSLPGVTTLSISNAPGAWSLRARLGGNSGSSHVIVHVKRVSAGTGHGTVSGGNGYVALSTLDSEIFTGSGDRASISLQFKVTGLSRHVSPATYLSSLIFTVQ